MNPLNTSSNRISACRTAQFTSDVGVTGVERIIGVLYGANLNQTSTDLPVLLNLVPSVGAGLANYLVTRFIVNNPSTSLTNATLGLFTAASGGGTTLVTDAAVSALTGVTKSLSMTMASGATGGVFTGNTLFPRVGTSQGATATADIYIFGIVFP